MPVPGRSERHVGEMNTRPEQLELSVIVPARNEAGDIGRVLREITRRLEAAEVPHEIVVVDDHSDDGTAAEVHHVPSGTAVVRCVENQRAPGIGNAIEFGIRQAEGQVLAIVMADGSDSPSDLVTYYQTISGGADCAFGSRFVGGSSVRGYPPVKLAVNRAGNWLASLIFGCRYNDLTNAFKAYRSSVVAPLLPLRSRGFDVTLELPVRAMMAGASYEVVPISWRNRSTGQSKMRLIVDGWRYLRRLILLRLRTL